MTVDPSDHALTGGNGQDRQAVPYEAARPSTRAQSVAAEIEQDIIRNGWQVGTVIGSVADLVERMGVSRSILREAVRIVEHHDVARMRRGPGGGLVVTAPDAEAVQRAASLYLSFAGVRPQHLYETRAAIEVACAGQAAERISEEGIERIRQVIAAEEQMGEQALHSRHHHDLHIVIAELTGNPAMSLFVTVLTQLTPPGPRTNIPEETSRYHAAHEALASAVISGDPALAQHRMRRHLAAIAVAVNGVRVDTD
jgi:DNA-binding FadR family transcriptional regulator